MSLLLEYITLTFLCPRQNPREPQIIALIFRTIENNHASVTSRIWYSRADFSLFSRLKMQSLLLRLVNLFEHKMKLSLSKGVSYFSFLSLTCHLLPLTIKARPRPGILALTCAPANIEASACHQKIVTRSTPTASLSTWDAHAREDTQEDSVTVKLTPAK